MRRLLAGAAVLLALALPVQSIAGHCSGSRPARSPTTKSSALTKKVPVKSSDRNVGTHGTAHRRSAPRGGGATSVGGSSGAAPRPSNRDTCQTCPGDERGRIEPSEAARKEFMKQTGYPDGRPGYVVVPVMPLECGGADDPSNMQWQTAEEASTKDKMEADCRR